jgi:DNA polymerase elongation subunit (family B)
MHQITGNHRICLEFEGTLYPSMFMAKKKYAGYKYQPFSLNAEKMIKGLEIIKNNHSHIVK